MRQVLFLLILVGLGAGDAFSAPRAVIELFTSQGCSSSPAADKLASEWAKDPELVVLSLPVDYWDYLGWRDTLAHHEFTLRQQAYSQARGDRDVYTPQIVVNGVTPIVGSQKPKVEDAIRMAAGGLPVLVGIANSLDGYIVSAGEGPEKGEIWLLPITRSARVTVDKGENSGASLTYTNVVRAMRKIGDYDGKPTTITLTRDEAWAPGADAFVVLVQQRKGPDPGRMLGAAIERDRAR